MNNRGRVYFWHCWKACSADSLPDSGVDGKTCKHALRKPMAVYVSLPEKSLMDMYWTSQRSNAKSKLGVQWVDLQLVTLLKAGIYQV